MDEAPPAPVRAAQYLRMSTEHQKYSMENQAAAIALYAVRRGYEIVRTYADPGRSGLTLKGRAGLKALIAEVVGGTADFSEILVFDVSRWGRFQDPDQAGHYEFMCREAGIPIRYCAETFENDGSISSSIMKQLKRIMAAEFSRELGVKVARGKRRIAAHGYCAGGAAPFALRRALIAKDGQVRMILARGQNKAMTSDRVRLVLGPEAEVETVRAIYRMYLHRRRSPRQIAEALNRTGRPAPAGGWSPFKVRRILRNEIYMGVQVFGRTRERLGTRPRLNPEPEWVRVPVVPAIIPPRTWNKAQTMTCPQARRYTDEALLAALRRMMRRDGELTHRSVLRHPGAPSLETFKARFGGLRRASQLAGCELKDAPRGWETYQILDAIRRLYAQHGRISCRIIERDLEGPSLRTVFGRFGSLDIALVAASLASPPVLPAPSRPHRWTKATVGAQLLRVHAAHGKVTQRLLNADPAAPEGRAVVRAFGSWAAAMDFVQAEGAQSQDQAMSARTASATNPTTSTPQPVACASNH